MTSLGHKLAVGYDFSLILKAIEAIELHTAALQGQGRTHCLIELHLTLVECDYQCLSSVCKASALALRCTLKLLVFQEDAHQTTPRNPSLHIMLSHLNLARKGTILGSCHLSFYS